MKLRPLFAQEQRLRSLLTEVSKFDKEQFELQAHWARYLCVLIAGFIENGLVEVYSRYAKACSNSFVSNFVESILPRIQNPKASRFVETAGAFNPVWADELEKFLESNGRKDALDAIMSNRHLIAHGKDSGISLIRVKGLL